MVTYSHFFLNLFVSATVSQRYKRGIVRCRSEEPDSFCMSEFRGKINYTLNIKKGNAEPDYA